MSRLHQAFAFAPFRGCRLFGPSASNQVSDGGQRLAAYLDDLFLFARCRLGCDVRPE